MSTDFPKPKFIEGGCVCGSIRYRVDFPENHDFLWASGSCQCTQCRKQTGSFFYACHIIKPKSAFKFTSSTDTLKHYSASPEAKRSFCGNCGAFLNWSRDGTDATSISVGSVDPLYLFGEGAGEGNDVPKGGYGLALANGGGTHEWCGNEIKGVTDDMPFLGRKRGTRYDGDDS